jgi:hypothetical protein
LEYGKLATKNGGYNIWLDISSGKVSIDVYIYIYIIAPTIDKMALVSICFSTTQVDIKTNLSAIECEFFMGADSVVSGREQINNNNPLNFYHKTSIFLILQ